MSYDKTMVGTLHHFAEIDSNNTVLRVITVGFDNFVDEDGFLSEEKGANFCREITNSTNRWIVTFKQNSNTNPRKNFAGIGDTFDEVRNAFICPKPFDNWIFNESTCTWIPPIPKPDDGKLYSWDQEKNQWVDV